MWDNSVEYVIDNDIYDDDFSENEENNISTYNDLTDYVKSFNNGNDIDLNNFKNVLDECYNIMEEKMFENEIIYENFF